MVIHGDFHGTFLDTICGNFTLHAAVAVFLGADDLADWTRDCQT